MIAHTLISLGKSHEECDLQIKNRNMSEMNKSITEAFSPQA
jgi:hypothetical protein